MYFHAEHDIISINMIINRHDFYTPGMCSINELKWNISGFYNYIGGKEVRKEEKIIEEKE